MGTSVSAVPPNRHQVPKCAMETTAATIESALRELQNLPTPVSSWRVEMGPDATDDPAVWVWTMLEHEEVDSRTRFQLRSMARDPVRRETDNASWVYVRFRGASEAERAL